MSAPMPSTICAASAHRDQPVAPLVEPVITRSEPAIS